MPGPVRASRAPAPRVTAEAGCISMSHSNIVRNLRNSVNANSDIRVPAEAWLRQCESQPGFVMELLDIALNAAEDTHCRFLAIAYVKKMVISTWSTNWPDNDRAGVKNRVIQLLSEKQFGVLNIRYFYIFPLFLLLFYSFLRACISCFYSCLLIFGQARKSRCCAASDNISRG